MILQCVSFVVSCTLSGTASQPSTLSSKQILAGVEAARKRIKDLDVTFSFDLAGKPARQIVSHWRGRLVLKGEMYFMDWSYAFSNPDGKRGPTARRKGSYDGDRGTFISPDDKNAMVQTGEPAGADPSTTGFFQVCQFTDPAGHVGNYKDSLLAALRHPKANVRPTLEVIDGRACHVVDVGFHASERGASGATYWIDVERGFSLLKTEHWIAPKLGTWKICRALRPVEVAKGVWLPLEGRVEVNHPAHSGVMVMKVELDAAGKPKLKVNAGLAGEFFSSESAIPAGYRVMDRDTNKTYTMPGRARK